MNALLPELEPGIYQVTLVSPVGTIVIKGTHHAVTSIEIARDPGAAAHAHGTRLLISARKQLREYFRGKRSQFSLPLDNAIGTAFQRAVWHQLQAIPFGETITYHDLARRATGNPAAARAAGRANATNPFMIVVPCHRVIGADGRLTGYRAGIPVKEWLLKHERAVLV